MFPRHTVECMKGARQVQGQGKHTVLYLQNYPNNQTQRVKTNITFATTAKCIYVSTWDDEVVHYVVTVAVCQ